MPFLWVHVGIVSEMVAADNSVFKLVYIGLDISSAKSKNPHLPSEINETVRLNYTKIIYKINTYVRLVFDCIKIH